MRVPSALPQRLESPSLTLQSPLGSGGLLSGAESCVGVSWEFTLDRQDQASLHRALKAKQFCLLDTGAEEHTAYITFIQSIHHHVSKSFLPLGMKEMYLLRDTYV